jgi:hypothetical protein
LNPQLRDIDRELGLRFLEARREFRRVCCVASNSEVDMMTG